MLLAQLRRRTATEAGGSNRNEICAMQISQVRNVHGSPFLTVPPVGICSAPCICLTSLQRLTEFPFFRKQNKRIRLPLTNRRASALWGKTDSAAGIRSGN